MLRRKVITVFCLIFAVNYLAAQKIDKTLYQRTTIVEHFSRGYRPDFVEYRNANAVFVRSFTRWSETLWEIETPPNSLRRITGIYMNPSPALRLPEAGQEITIFFRWVPEKGTVIDYWIEANNTETHATDVAQTNTANTTNRMPSWAVAAAIGGVIVFCTAVFVARRKK